MVVGEGHFVAEVGLQLLWLPGLDWIEVRKQFEADHGVAVGRPLLAGRERYDVDAPRSLHSSQRESTICSSLALATLLGVIWSLAFRGSKI